MNKDELRKSTCLVVTKDGKYLAGYGKVIKMIRWDPNITNAWRTRDKEEAKRVAEKYGGTLFLFNPIVWQIKPLQMEENK